MKARVELKLSVVVSTEVDIQDGNFEAARQIALDYQPTMRLQDIDSGACAWRELEYLDPEVVRVVAAPVNEPVNDPVLADEERPF